MLDSTSIIDYNHEVFRTAIKDIVHQIKQDDFDPDYIVGIVRGGAIPAVYLSHQLKKPVVMIHWSGRDNSVGGNESNWWIPEDLAEGKQILLVDDIVDGGDTITQIIQDWDDSVNRSLRLENIRIASLVYNVAQPVVVNYYHTKINREEDNRWFVYDWEC